MRMSLCRSSLVAIGLGVAALTVSAHETTTPQGAAGLKVPPRHATGHVGDHDDQSWPPQPRGLQNPIDHSDAGLANMENLAEPRRAGMRQRFDALEQHGAGRADFREALGGKFTRIAIVEEADKSGRAPRGRLIYFSRARNATVEVQFEGAETGAVQSLPAAEYQPEITDEEVAEATRIGRQHFNGLGRSRVQALKGYGILAYRPQGKGFYENRVLYVSFHAGDDAPPEFSAWVDLTNQRVVKAREERQ